MSLTTERHVQHRALLYRADDEFLDVAAAFLRDGFVAGDALVLAVQPTHVDALLGQLEDDVRSCVRTTPPAGVEVLPWEAVDAVGSLVRGLAKNGRGVRVLGQHHVDCLSEDQLEELFRADAAFSLHASVPEARLLCTYDLRRTQASVVDLVRRTHSTIVENGDEAASPTYTDARRYLQEAMRRTLSGPAGSLDSLADPKDAVHARAFVQEAAQRAGLHGERLDTFVLACSEVVTNACKYACLEHVDMWQDGPQVVCDVHDRGPGFEDPLVGYRKPGFEQESGWGIWLARQLADSVELRNHAGGAVVRLRLRTE